MKIVLLTKYGDLAASTRQRMRQYAPYLEAEGFELEHRPLLDDQYLAKLYDQRQRDWMSIARRYISRLLWLASGPDIDIIWLHLDLFPGLPGVFERLARIPGKPIVFDFDDAVFHSYDLHPNPILRMLMQRKLHVTIRGAELVFAGNAYLADYARPLCRQTEIVPTVLNADVFRPGPRTTAETTEPPRIGWIGSPSTWDDYLLPMLGVLTEAAARHGARISAVGGRPHEHPLLDAHRWGEDSEVARIQEMDIGIMPLTDTPWARGKCGYKLIQYMACGLPVIASPVGVNSDIVEHGVNGFLARDDAEWRDALDRLLSDPDLRQRMGRAGRRKVEAEYSLQVWGPRVARFLAEVVRKGSSA